MPLPTPNSVTCSPIHITKEEPAIKGHDDDQERARCPQRLSQQTVALDHHIVAQRLQNGDGHGGIAGDGLNLLLALLAAVFGQPLRAGMAMVSSWMMMELLI